MGVSRKVMAERMDPQEEYCDAYCKVLAEVGHLDVAGQVITEAGGNPEVYDSSLPLSERYKLAAQALTELANDPAKQQEVTAVVTARLDAPQPVGQVMLFGCELTDCPLYKAHQNNYSGQMIVARTRSANGGSLGLTATFSQEFLESPHQGRIKHLH